MLDKKAPNEPKELKKINGQNRREMTDFARSVDRTLLEFVHHASRCYAVDKRNHQDYRELQNTWYRVPVFWECQSIVASPLTTILVPHIESGPGPYRVPVMVLISRITFLVSESLQAFLTLLYLISN